jgi:HAD superfamily hydrolase (TIGR01484 family)
MGTHRRRHSLAADEVRPAHARAGPQFRRAAPAPRRGARLKPLSEFPLDARRRIRGVLADIDDTLTTEGKLPSSSFGALERLHEAGLLVIPVTGRPAGWCDHIARMWPVDAVVGENGAFWFRYDASAKKLFKRYVVGEDERRRRAARFDAIAQRILAEVPGCAIASDQAYREADLAIDFCEDVAPLPRSAVAQIVSIMESVGLTAKVSSIHVNGWFGGYDKLSTARRMMREEFAIDLDRARDEFVFVGDSPNDQPMFAYFPHAIGVANVRDMADLMTSMPAWVTMARGGAGFAEVAEVILASVS